MFDLIKATSNHTQFVPGRFTGQWLTDVRTYLRMWVLFGEKFDIHMLSEGCRFPTDGVNAAIMLRMDTNQFTRNGAMRAGSELLKLMNTDARK